MALRPDLWHIDACDRQERSEFDKPFWEDAGIGIWSVDGPFGNALMS
jgi:hypothetical protein